MGEAVDARGWKDGLRAELTSAIKRGDAPAVRALRSTLAAIENAEAVDDPDTTVSTTSPIAGSVEIASSELPRRRLSPREVRAVVEGEIRERHAAAAVYERSGHEGRADELRAEAAVLESLVGR